MTSAVYDRTQNLGLGLLEFNFPNWADDANLNTQLIDAAMQYLGISIKGAWTNSTAYMPGDLVVDSDSGTLWRCDVQHTSASTGTFAQDRAAHPTFWYEASQSLHARGQWQPATSYYVNDVVYDGYTWAMATRQFTSSTTLNADIANGDFVVITDSTSAVDDSEAAAQVAMDNATSSTTSATNASISATNSQNSAVAASNSQAQAASSANDAQSSEDDAELAAAQAQALYNAMLPDAPADGKYYSRRNVSWQAVVGEAPNDGLSYGRRNTNWVPLGNAIIADAQPTPVTHGQMWYESDTGNLFIYYSQPSDPDSSQWVQIGGYSSYATGAGGGIAEAPVDTNIYGRKDGSWYNIGGAAAVTEPPNDGKSYVRKFQQWQELVFPTVPFVFDTNGDCVCKFGANIVIRIKPTGLILTKDDIEVFSVTV
jgi:hypothetical protein